MQGTPAPKKRDYSGRVYKPRKCEDCPVVFTPESSGQKRCESCQRERTLHLKREDQSQRNASRRSTRYCADCGVELPVSLGRPSDRCVPCRKRHRKEEARERRQEYLADGRNAQWQRTYALANADKIRESQHRWRQAHPESDSAALHRRRMRLDAGKLDELDRLLSRFYRRAIKGDSCYYCGSPDAGHVDHYFPLAKGGSDRWFNLYKACRKCNLSKGTKCGTAFLLLSGG